MDLALDVQCRKLTEWLVTRSVIDPKWQVNIAPIRKAIGESVVRLPDQEVPEISEITREPVIHYFHCRKILSILETRLGDAAKSWLGNYKDKELQDWAKILKAYKKNNINIAEAARILERNTIYEIPSIKNQLIRNDKETTDLKKKIESNERAIINQTKSFEKACSDLGIEGRDLRGELINLTARELPKQLNSILEMVKSDELLKAIKYHEEFLQFVSCTIDPEQKSESFTNHSLNTIRLLREKAHELEEIITDEPIQEEVTIDWDMNMDMDQFEITDDTAVDLSGENVENDGLDNVEIDETTEINWDLDDVEIQNVVGVEDLLEAKNDNETNLDSWNVDGKVNLLDKTTRIKLLNNVLELNGFLKYRLDEIKSDAQMLDQMKLNANKTIKNNSLETVQSYFTTSQNLLDALTGENLQNLLMIQQKGAYLDRLEQSLLQQLRSVDKFRQSINQLEAKCAQLSMNSTELRDKLNGYRDSTIDLKSNLEKVLCKHFKGREVNIVGEINYL